MPHPDYFLFGGASDCNSPCVVQNPAFAWNHGDVAPEIARTWLGFVGPGVKRAGDDDHVWSDHTDVRPTILSLVGLKDAHVHDGRVLIETIEDWALPRSLRVHRESAARLGQIYKRLNAPFGDLGQDSLVVSTAALKSDSEADAVYVDLAGRIARWTDQRNALVARIRELLNRAECGGGGIDVERAEALMDEGTKLIFTVHGAAEEVGN